jgi:hypothetical protein
MLPNLRQLIKICSIAANDATSAPVPELSGPDVVISNQPRLRVYPRWFLLKRQNIVPVALKTRYVGFAAFDNVPQWAEKVFESIDSLIWLDSSQS